MRSLPAKAGNAAYTRPLECIKKMNNQLEKIFEAEDRKDFESAFLQYEELDLEKFDNWKYFYFFLWYVLIEEFPLGAAELVEKYDLQTKLKSITDFGYEKYEDLPEFEFIVGYTMGLFPYLFGEWNEFEKIGNEHLKTALSLEPNNIIFELAYLGSQEETPEEYLSVREKARDSVLSYYSGHGLLNKYFRDVLGRIKK